VLQAKVTSLDFGGWDATAEKLDEINQALAEGLSRQGQNSRAELTEVDIQESAIIFTYKTPRER
jgi:hypothetical protein